MSNYSGIDYGLGRTNINLETGIRYGVISTHSLCESFWDYVENDYGDPTCGACGSPATDAATIDAEWAIDTHDEYACTHCERTFSSDDAYPESANGWQIADGEYKVQDCLDSDAMVIEAPYFTRAAFCSPCVPGACSLESPCDTGAKAYCFGHDWFDGGVAPYPVYSVATGELVQPTAQS